MNQERQFRLFSLAVLGLTALACIGEVGATDFAAEAINEPAYIVNQAQAELSSPASSDGIAEAVAVDLELDAVAEVEALNATSFHSFIRGASALAN